jgi:DNA-binding FadR family transcriptional regulator
VDNRKAKRLGLRSLEKLIEFIERGDGPGAEAHWRKHTASVEKTMRNWLESKRVVDLLDE